MHRAHRDGPSEPDTAGENVRLIQRCDGVPGECDGGCMRTVYISDNSLNVRENESWPYAAACPMFNAAVKCRTLRIYPDVGQTCGNDADNNDAHLEASARKVDR